MAVGLKLTNDQRMAVGDEASRVVSSCPGSGKTRTVTAKIVRCLESVRGTSRKIACITYTNAATNEIVSRLFEMQGSGDEFYYEVNTIHSFCLNGVVRPYCHLIPDLRERFEVVAQDHAAFQQALAETKVKFSLAAWIEEPFGGIQRDVNGHLIVPSDLPLEAAKYFIGRLHESHFITFADIVYYALEIAREFPFVARAISNRFAWILVDEFQDTSEIQVALLEVIHAVGNSRFFLVGDQNQSIYGFAGARPDLMSTVAATLGAKSDVSLLGNFRCSKQIVDVAERLCPRSPPMTAIGPTKDFAFPPQYFRTATPMEAVLGHFLPEVLRQGIPYGSTAILAAWWTSLPPLAKALRDRGIPVIGPGARPYRRSLAFGQFAEAAASYITSKDADAATTAQRNLFFMVLQLCEEPDWRIFTYTGKVLLCRLLKEAERLSKDESGAVRWLQGFRDVAAEILLSDGLIDSKGRAVLVESAESMCRSIRENVPDHALLRIDDLGIFARPKECVQLMTMHASKGREFDAVAVVDFQEGRVPHFNARNQAEIAEARRLTYVAATRARRLLMFFSHASDRRNPPSRFLFKDEMNLA